ncbi:MAG: hypothetical protein QM746_11170 [Cloacibacterium sp.]
MKKIYYIILLSIIPNFYITQIFKFSFTGSATCPTPNNTPFIQNPNVNVTPFFRQGVNCSATASSFNSNAWPTATVQDLNSYVEVTIVATSGYQMNLASFSFDLVRSASGPVAGRIAMDDGTGTFSQTNDFTPTESSQTITWDFADYTVQSGYIIRFRIYGWQASSGTGTLRLNNVTLLGAVTQSSNNTGSGNSPFTVSGTNVGLGTTNPLTKLDVRKDLNTNDYIKIAQNNSQFQIGRVSDNKSLELAVLDNGISIIQSKEQGVSYNPLILNPANNGNVGIGTMNPQSKLEVNGDITLGNMTSHEYNVVFRPDDNSWRSALVGYSSSIAYDDYIGLKTKFGTIRFITNDGYESARIANGRLGIGTTNPQATLDVAGTSSFSGNMKVEAKVETKEIKVTTTPTADFVFAENYHLPKLEEVEKHIKEKKHLPEIAPAKEMEKEGVNIGEFQIKLLQKIEELTLYSIEQNKQIKELKEEINKLKNKK